MNEGNISLVLACAACASTLDPLANFARKLAHIRNNKNPSDAGKPQFCSAFSAWQG